MSYINSIYNRAFVGECVIASSNDEKPILATDGLNSCIGFAGRARDSEFGFLVHFYGPNQVDDFYSNGVRLLSDLNGKGTFECVIKGGCIKTSCSKKIVDKIKSNCKNSSINFDIIKEYPLSEKIGVLKTLSLDTRTGEFGEYTVSDDPNPRELSEEDEKRIQTFDIAEKLTYIKI